MAVTEDASTPATAVSAGGSTATTLASASFSPPAGSWLVALCSVNYSSNTSFPSLAVSDSASGTWNAGPVASSTAAPGLSQIFTRYCATAPGSITVTFSRGADATAAMLQLAVRVCNGAASSQSGAASASPHGTTTPAAVTLTTTRAGSAVYVAGAAAGNTTPTAGTGTATITVTHDTTDGGYPLAGSQNPLATVTPGSETLSWTIGSAQAWCLAALEILPALPVSGLLLAGFP